MPNGTKGILLVLVMAVARSHCAGLGGGVDPCVGLLETGLAFLNAGRSVTDLLARNFLKTFAVWWIPPMVVQSCAVVLSAAWAVLLFTGSWFAWSTHEQVRGHAHGRFCQLWEKALSRSPTWHAGKRRFCQLWEKSAAGAACQMRFCYLIWLLPPTSFSHLPDVDCATQNACQ
jgi:hypothetical protein